MLNVLQKTKGEFINAKKNLKVRLFTKKIKRQLRQKKKKKKRRRRRRRREKHKTNKQLPTHTWSHNLPNVMFYSWSLVQASRKGPKS